MYLVMLILTLALFLDFRDCRLPVVFTGTAMLVSQFRLLLCGSADKALAAMGFSLLIVLMLYPMFMIGALGGGDVKLLMILPCYFGFRGSLMVVVWAFAAGAVLGTAKLVSEGEFRQRLTNLCAFLHTISRTGRITAYDTHHGKGNTASNQIHFSLPLFISAAAAVGGIIRI